MVGSRGRRGRCLFRGVVSERYGSVSGFGVVGPGRPTVRETVLH